MEGGGAFQQSILQPESIYYELHLADIRIFKKKQSHLNSILFLYGNIRILYSLQQEYLASIKMTDCTQQLSQFVFNW